METMDSGLGIFYADLSTDKLSAGQKVMFTFYWLETKKAEKTTYSVEVKEIETRDRQAQENEIK